MGRGGKGGKGKSTYVHKVTHNEKAHGSDEKRVETLKRLKVSQLQSQYNRQKARMERYLPDDVRERMNAKVAPEYALKGGARVAREFYRDPNDKRHLDDHTEVDLISKYGADGKLWTHCPNNEGRVLLTSMLRLAVGMHNITARTKDACGILEHMVQLDADDHLQARQLLVRCYMDSGLAEKARQIVEKAISSEGSRAACCFHFTKALIEFISFSIIGEEGSSAEVAERALREAHAANPYAVFLLAYHKIYLGSGERDENGNVDSVLEYTSHIAPHYLDIVGRAGKQQKSQTELSCRLVAGSVEDAISFVSQDCELWLDVDGAIEWVQHFVTTQQLTAPEEEKNEQQKELMLGDEDDADGDTAPALVEPNTVTNTLLPAAASAAASAAAEAAEDDDDDMDFSESFDALSAEEKHRMYMGMFRTGLEIVADT